MPKTRFASSFAASCVSVILGASSAFATESAPKSDKWDPWAEIGGYASNRDYAQRGEATLWMPLIQSATSMVFTDIRGKLFDADQHEGNLALGYRFMAANGWNPGIWIGVDRRYTSYGNDFDQVSFGGELLSRDWDLRLNGYAPLEDVKAVAGGGAGTIVVSGSNIFLSSDGLSELAFWGLDAEVGYRVPLERFGMHGASPPPGAPYNDLRLFAGGFYFDNADFDGEVAGPRVRAEWRVENVVPGWEGSRLTFDAQWQYDDVREEQYEAGVRLRIPLGSETGQILHASLSPQEKRITEGLKRDTDIVAQAVRSSGSGGGASQEQVEDAETGVDIDSIVIQSSGGNITTTANTLVVLQGGGGNYNEVISFTDYTMIGGGTSIQLRGRTSGTIATYTAPGTRPTISGGFVLNGILSVGGSTVHVAGMDVIGNNICCSVGLYTDGTMVAEDMNVSNFDYGVYQNSNSLMTLRDSTVSNASNTVLYVDSCCGGIGAMTTITGTTLNGSNYGVEVASDATMTLTGVTMTGSYSNDLFLFNGGASTIVAGSSINDSGVTFGGQRCNQVGGTFTGTLGFTSGSVTPAGCP